MTRRTSSPRRRTRRGEPVRPTCCTELTRRQWAIYKKKVYDLSDYLYTVKYYSGSSGTDMPNYGFLNDDVSSLWSTKVGQDITKDLDRVFAKMSSDEVSQTMKCLDTAFMYGEMDFRLEAKCTVQNYLLLAFAILIFATMGAKCALPSISFRLAES